MPEIQGSKGIVMIMGAPDSGKTTLAGYLAKELAERGERVAYVDGDMGQSILGPPTTQSMAVLDGSCSDLDKAHVLASYFVGSTSPRGHGPETLVGLKRLVEKSRAQVAGIAIVDTTGYVVGEDARELKYQKIDLLEPRHIVAIQHAGEIEHILKTQENLKRAVIYRLDSSSCAKRRSPDERRHYRWRQFLEYFKEVRIQSVDLEGTSLTGTHRIRIQNGPTEELEGLLVGLSDSENFLLALGTVEHLSLRKEVLSCLVPSAVNLDGMRSVRLGNIKLDLSQETNGERFIGYGR